MWAVGKARLCIRLASVLLWLEMWGSLAGAWTILMQLGTRVLFRSRSMRIPIPSLTLVQGLCVRGSLATAASSIWLGSWSGPFPLFSLTKSKSWEEQLHLSRRWVGGVDSLKGLSVSRAAEQNVKSRPARYPPASCEHRVGGAKVSQGHFCEGICTWRWEAIRQHCVDRDWPLKTVLERSQASEYKG